MASLITLSMAYGIDISPRDDQLVHIATKAMEAVCLGSNAESIMFDFFPWRKDDRWSTLDDNAITNHLVSSRGTFLVFGRDLEERSIVFPALLGRLSRRTVQSGERGYGEFYFGVLKVIRAHVYVLIKAKDIVRPSLISTLLHADEDSDFVKQAPANIYMAGADTVRRGVLFRSWCL